MNLMRSYEEQSHVIYYQKIGPNVTDMVKIRHVTNVDRINSSSIANVCSMAYMVWLEHFDLVNNCWNEHSIVLQLLWLKQSIDS